MYDNVESPNKPLKRKVAFLKKTAVDQTLAFNRVRKVGMLRLKRFFS